MARFFRVTVAGGGRREREVNHHNLDWRNGTEIDYGTSWTVRGDWQCLNTDEDLEHSIQYAGEA